MRRFIDDNGRVYLLVPADVAPRLARPLREAINENRRRGNSTSADVLAVVEDFERVSVASGAAETPEQGNGSNGSAVDGVGRMLLTMSTAEVAAKIDRSPRQVCNLVADGQLEAERVRGDWRVFDESVEQYLDQRGSR